MKPGHPKSACAGARNNPAQRNDPTHCGPEMKKKTGGPPTPPGFCRKNLLRRISGMYETGPFPRQSGDFPPDPSSFSPLFIPEFCTIHGEKILQFSPCDTFLSF
jgi:hypothetical protein